MEDHWISWSLLIGAILFLYVMFGYWAGKGPWGILIDRRNKMSLSRLQLLGWTLIVVSVYPILGITEQTLQVEMGSQLLALIGISVAGLAGASIVKDVKDNTKPHQEVMNQIANNRLGSLATRAQVSQFGSDQISLLDKNDTYSGGQVYRYTHGRRTH